MCIAIIFRFTIWEDKEAEFHEKLQKLKNPEEFEVCNLRGIIREIKECVTKVTKNKKHYCLANIFHFLMPLLNKIIICYNIVRNSSKQCR